MQWRPGNVAFAGNREKDMLQKLENAWLNILRAVVVVASGLLLACVVIFGLATLQGFGEGPGEALAPPAVESAALLKQLTAPAATAASGASAAGAAAAPAGDPNKVYYDRTTAAIVTFVAKHSSGGEVADRDQVFEITRDRAESFDTPALVTGYAQGLAETMEALLASSALQKQAAASTALDVVNRVLDLYTEEFNRQLEASQAEISQARQEHLQDKADAARNLYFALAAFGLFLLIVFLSIFIRIERNLRHLERGARAPRDGLLT
ncbi:MAG: hypothetical protein ACOY41_11360 [Pseudomonadota bacterium]